MLPASPAPLMGPPAENEPEEDSGGLGGLSASMISRSGKAAAALDMPFDENAFTVQFVPEDPNTEPPPLDLGGPLIMKKGAARAAPPTDPHAINHLVSGDGDAAPDPLAGQPDFDPGEPVHFEGPLSGKHVLITAGPTHEAIDPVRYIANRSSGKQGFAIAAAAAMAGARVTLIAGPVNLATPAGVDRIDVESAEQMAKAVKHSLPADVGIMVAAVADWRIASVAKEKIKKRGSAPPMLMLTENPDILATVSGDPRRPRLLIGFAAETEDVIKNAKDKRKRKGADWIVANDVSGDVMGGAANTVHIVTAEGIESLPEMPKDDVAHALVERIVDAFA